MSSTTPRAVRIVAADDDVGRRIDNFLLGHLKGVPRSRVYRLIRNGEVRVNSRRVAASYRLVTGDEVRVPPVMPAPGSGDRAGYARPPQTDWMRERILLEDEDLLVLDKPAGLAVHGGSGISLGVIELLRALCGPGQYLELVHRLDRETSGCLLVAKRASALRNMHAQFRDGTVDKRYLALLVGRWPGRARTVDAPLATEHRRGGERHVRVDGGGKPAATHFVPLERFPAASLAEIQLKTGRTHQIRVHAASIGHPVAGDNRYGPPAEPVAAACGLRRLFLHARSLTLQHPRTGTPLTVEAPLPPDLLAVLETLRAGPVSVSG